MLDRRFGLFILRAEVVEQPRLYALVMKDVVVHRCEHMFAYNTFDYSGWSERFELLPAEKMVPEYEIVFSINGGIFSYEFRKTLVLTTGNFYIDGLMVDVNKFVQEFNNCLELIEIGKELEHV